MFGKINKHFYALLLLVAILLSISSFTSNISADSSPVSVPSINEDFSNCSGTINGVASPVYYGVAQGQTVDLTINNTSPTDTLDITINAPSGTVSPTLTPNSGSSNTTNNSQYSGDFSASGIITVTAMDAGASCTSGNGNSTNFYIEDGNGSMACTVSGKNWDINGQFSSVVSNAYLYEGSTFKSDQQPSNNNLTLNYSALAESSAQTYYLYNGPGQSYSQIGSATCPAVAAAATSNTTGGSTTTKTTNNHSSSPGPGLSKTSDITYSVLSKKKDNVTGYLIILMVIGGLLIIAYLASLVFVIKKAGHFSWVALAPIYNTWLAFNETQPKTKGSKH